MINYIKGDLFSSKSSILCHACNCYGSWGGGIAVIFRKKFPRSYKIYNEHCKKTKAAELLGTTLLIEPENGQRVACLFTSNLTGAKKLPPNEIVHYTDLAMKDLIRQLHLENENGSGDKSLAEAGNGKESETNNLNISMPKINAGLFAVPWDQTEEVLEKYANETEITVYEI
ncbi:ADP-ribose 1''-phosphate phosphatase [[Candida] railenensis]|uniref:ADP-ribose 1''-phosphate phosphatase n=1 Tax=[Candida] railenensis TaxID=45579 RepID=A0A9P0QM12_9ASCO|nr:ADP-ribose 1''-phosphate phosphatase [[Candida] railenensis]